MAKRIRLTKKQYLELAVKLLNTRANVYEMAKRDYGAAFADEDFDKLEVYAKVFRCENCDLWQESGEKSLDISGYCTDCVVLMDEDE